MKEYKLFVQRIGLVGITNILISLSSLILLPVLTKNLTIQDYGMWGLFNTTVAFIPILINFGLPYTMVRFLAVKTEKEKIQDGFYSITFIMLLTGIVASLILFLLSKQIAMILFDGNTIVSGILAITVLISAISASFFTFFRTFQQMKIFSILSLLQTYTMVAIVIFLVKSGYGIAGAVFGYFIVQFVICMVAMVFVIRQIGFKFPKFKNIKEYLSFGIPTIPSNLSTWMVDMSDRYVIGILLGTAFVGYYSPGYTLGNIIVMFMAPFTLLLPSLLSSYYDQNRMEEVEIHLQYSLKYFMLLAIPAVFGLSFLSRPLLMLLSTPEIAQNGYLITPFVAVSALLVGIYGITSQVLALEKKTKIIGSMWIIAAIINLVLNILLVPYFGIMAAAVTTLTAYAFTFLITLFYSHKHIKIKFELGFIFKSVFASILMSLVIIFINPTTVIGIIITIGISSVVYMALILLFKGISSNEIEFFKDLVRG